MGQKTHVGIVKFEKDLQGLEKRSHPRFLLNLPVEYYPIDSPIVSGSTQGYTVNASQGGLMICLRESLRKGQHVNLKIYFSSNSNLITIETKAEVMWLDASCGEDGAYQYGVKFIEISPESHERLKAFLDGLSPDLMN